MEVFDMTPDSTERLIVAQGLKQMDAAKDLEHDHEKLVLCRLLREKATKQ